MLACWALHPNSPHTFKSIGWTELSDKSRNYDRARRTTAEWSLDMKELAWGRTVHSSLSVLATIPA